MSLNVYVYHYHALLFCYINNKHYELKAENYPQN